VLVTMPDSRVTPGFQRPAPLWRRAAAAAGRQCAARSAWSAACAGRRAHTGYMGRMIWTILGVILAIWLAFTAIDGIFATLKTFLITGLIAAVVVIVVSLLAGRPRRG
jgi:predicted lipid-binding transport protein (Tim44 family)